MKPIYKYLIPVALFAVFIISNFFYTLIRDYVGLHSNDKIIAELQEIVSKESSDLDQLTSFVLNADTYSQEFKINNTRGQGITFKSFTDISESGLSPDEYKSTYYNNISKTTSSCYVPDFNIPKGKLKLLMDRLKIYSIKMEEQCEQQTVTMEFEYRHFYPTDRKIKLCFFSEKICGDIKAEQETDPDGYFWTFKIDNNWIITSEKIKY